MKAVQVLRYDPERRGVRVAEVPEPPQPGPGEVTIAIDASPIHPADLLSLVGGYATPPPLPLVPGGEAMGRVVAVGRGVAGLVPGDRVIPLSRGNWVERRTLPAGDVVRVPEGDPLQLAMLRVVPSTAHLMLTGIVDLAPGQGCIQNAANSSVGLAVARLAARRGVVAINVVRRAELVGALAGLGIGNVFVDGPDLASRVRAAFPSLEIALAFDAVAGEASLGLSECLSSGGTLVSYGLLSGEPCMVRPNRAIFEGVRLTGFWVSQRLAAMSRDEIEKHFTGLAPLVVDGTLSTPIEATYVIADALAAIEHAARFGRSGKIMILPNG